MKKQYIYMGMALVLAFPVQTDAQEQVKDTTLNRTVVVEQEYAPDIMTAPKINVLPRVEPPATVKHEVEYADGTQPAARIPASVMEAYVGEEKQRKATPGYARLGYGNYGNADVYAHYLFQLTGRDKLDATFGFGGMNGDLDLSKNSGEQWNAHYYRTRAALDYTHAFNKMELNASGNFGLSNFNLLHGKQRFTSGDVQLGVASTDNSLPVQFRAEAGLLYYERAYNYHTVPLDEMIVRLKGDVYAPIDARQQVGLAVDMNLLSYGCSKNLENVRPSDYDTDYATVDLNPYYRLENERWKIRVGAHVDLAFKGGKKLQAAPDVLAQYTPLKYISLYAQATGGRVLNDFRRLEALCPYGRISNALPAAYEPLNATVGLKAHAGTGLWFHLYGGYRMRKDELISYEGLEDIGVLLRNSLFAQGDLNDLYAGTELEVGVKETYRIHASLLFHSWDAAREINDSRCLAFLPKLEADIHIDANPLEELQLRLGFRCITRSKYADYNGGERVEPVENLYLSAGYELFRGVGIYFHMDNLLNKTYQYYPGYPTEGLNFVGGASFRF